MQREYKTRHIWVGALIHWELCKKFKFEHANKWYMNNLVLHIDLRPGRAVKIGNTPV